MVVIQFVISQIRADVFGKIDRKTVYFQAQPSRMFLMKFHRGYRFLPAAYQA